MDNCLYMICPSDNLEPVILDRFKGHKYFYSSLGNNISSESETLSQLAELISKNDITEINLVLCEDNAIVLDALNTQKFIAITGLNKAYQDLLQHKESVTSTWQARDQHVMILSYYLNKKIVALNSTLSQHLDYLPNINGLLYSKDYDSFRQIYSNLVCIETASLN